MFNIYFNAYFSLRIRFFPKILHLMQQKVAFGGYIEVKTAEVKEKLIYLPRQLSQFSANSLQFIRDFPLSRLPFWLPFHQHSQR